jgi:hypothetical protein
LHALSSLTLYRKCWPARLAVDVCAFGSPSAGSGTAVLLFSLLFVFRSQSEKRNKRIVKYHAAAGYSLLNKRQRNLIIYTVPGE